MVVPTNLSISFINKTFKVLVTNRLFPVEGLSLLEKYCEVILPESIPPTREELLLLSKNVDGIIWTVAGMDARTKCLDTEMLDASGSKLKVVSLTSTGLDHINMKELKRRNIVAGYIPDVASKSVADIAIGLMIAAARRFHESRLEIDRNNWISHPQWMLGQDIDGSTVGIVGFGKIGQAIAKRLQGFEVANILYSGHRAKPEAEPLQTQFVPFTELLQKSDFIIISAPLTAETRNMFNVTAFAQMKRTSVLVNVSRGQIVKTDDLVKALKSGQIFAAGLDVTDPEPLPSDHKLMKLPNVVLTPHLGAATGGIRNKKALIAVYNILLALDNQPLISTVPEM